MPKLKLSPIRLAFAATVLVITVFIVAALFQRQSSVDLTGSWQLAALDGIKAPQSSGGPDEGFEIHGNGTFDWPSFQIAGNWKVVDTNLILHAEKYDGKTQAQFRAETEAKYPSDPAMQKIADKVFEDLKLAISADASALTINLGGTTQSYSRVRKR